MFKKKGSSLKEDLLTEQSAKESKLNPNNLQELKIDRLQWSNLTYKITKEKQEKKILNKVFGWAKKGEITALVGKSGAGKTSLLNVLAQKIQKKGNNLEGKISINEGKVPKPEFLRSLSAYMRQDDTFHESLTPEEIIWNAAKLTIKGTDEDRKEIMDKLFKDLNLESCRNARVGGFNRKGISGGQKRRVSLALELLNNPQILFLDEPTSGLDSFTALLVMSLVKKEAK